MPKIAIITVVMAITNKPSTTQATYFDTTSFYPGFKLYCEAQGKGRARVGPRKVTQRSFMDGGWWMVDILSLMLYTKFGCHHPPDVYFYLTNGQVGHR